MKTMRNDDVFVYKNDDEKGSAPWWNVKTQLSYGYETMRNK